MGTIKKPVKESASGAFEENKQVKEKETFSVFYINRHQPEQIHVTTVSAANAGSAERKVLKKLQNITVLSVSEGGNAKAEPVYPSARFIRGRFELTTYADDLRMLKYAD
ncbi:MAG: hypothetical protein ISR52_06975 [Rhodospirillales bacterium]|nr:hypothetical protein [Rhodospirillales bacterium]